MTLVVGSRGQTWLGKGRPLSRHATLSIALACVIGLAPGCDRSGTKPGLAVNPPAAPVPAAPKPPPPPPIRVHPASTTLLPGDPGVQLIVEGTGDHGGRAD